MKRYATKMPCRDGPGTHYTNIYPSTLPVKMCIVPGTPIYEIEITKTDNPTGDSYYAWEDLDGKISMIYYGFFILNICFPYGVRAEEAAGRGNVVRVDIKEIQEAI